MSDSKKQTVYVVSNMFPSEIYPNYGIFVKRFIKLISGEFNTRPITMKKKTGVTSKSLAYIKLYASILKLLFDKKKENLIYVHFPLYVAPVLLPLVWFRRNIVLNFHGSDLVFDNWYKKTLAFFLKITAMHSKIVVPSSYYKNEVQRVMSLGEREILVYPSGGVNQDIFYPIEKKDNTFVLGFVSNFIEGKGWKVFLDALELLVEEKNIGSFKAIMVGEGKDKHTILETIEKRKLPVTVLGNVPQEELINIYALFSMFIFPSYRKEESLGLVGIEAMMCGIPVVASKVGGPMGYVNEGENGYLFGLRDAVELSQKITTYYHLPRSTKLKIKENCLKKAAEYESKLITKQLISFLHQ